MHRSRADQLQQWTHDTPCMWIPQTVGELLWVHSKGIAVDGQAELAFVLHHQGEETLQDRGGRRSLSPRDTTSPSLHTSLMVLSRPCAERKKTTRHLVGPQHGCQVDDGVTVLLVPWFITGTAGHHKVTIVLPDGDISRTVLG